VSARPTATYALIVAVLACAAMLPACGRRGPLEPPPGTADRRAQTAQDTAASSSFAGSTSMRPTRQTETTDNTLDPDLPATPDQPADIISGPITGAPATTTTTRSGAVRGGRRSPPPNTPFILDPLL
jgi:predicted small lipoprotein YifL